MSPLLLLLLLAVAGLLIYAFANNNQKASTIGLVVFAGAYLALLSAGHVAGVLR